MVTHKKHSIGAAASVAALAAALKTPQVNEAAARASKRVIPAAVQAAANLYSQELGELMAPKAQRGNSAGRTVSALPAALQGVQTTRSTLSTTKDGIRIKRSNLITTINGSGSVATAGSTYPTSVQTFVCNPLVGNTFPWLVSIASRFGRMRVHSMSMTYDPVVGTDTNGQVVLAWTPDINLQAPYAFDAIAANEGAVKGPVYASMTVRCPVKGGSTFRYTAGDQFGAIANLLTDNYRTVHPVGNSSETYWTSFGQIIVASTLTSRGGNSYTDTIGSLSLSYDIELMDPVYSLIRESFTDSSAFGLFLPQTVNIPKPFDNSSSDWHFQGFNSSVAWPSSPNFLTPDSAQPTLTDGKRVFFPVPGTYSVQLWTNSGAGVASEIVSISATGSDGVIDLHTVRVNGDTTNVVAHMAYLTTVAPNSSIVYAFTRPLITQSIFCRVIVQHSTNQNFAY